MRVNAQSFNQDPGKDVKFKNPIDMQVLGMIDEYDAGMLNYLTHLYRALNGENLDLEKVKNAVDALQQFNTREQYNYLNNLLHPETQKGVKIPSAIPVPSCAFQLHNTITLTTNSKGYLGVMLNPNFLCNKTELPYTYEKPTPSRPQYDVRVDWLSSLWVNNHETLQGNLPNNNWVAMNLQQEVPGVYDQYRLVSASVVVKYIGRLDIVSGIIGGAIIFDENPYVGGSVSAINTEIEGPEEVSALYNPTIAKYGNFDLALDSFYYQDNMLLEGLRELYFPLDNSFEEYVKIAECKNATMQAKASGPSETFYNYQLRMNQDYYKSGFNYFIYTRSAPPSSPCLLLEIFFNFECLPNAEFLNYLPISSNPGCVSSEGKKMAQIEVQKKPIMKASETTAAAEPPSLFSKMIKKFGNSLPSIGKMVLNGLTNFIPFLKPGLALAGTMINAASGGETPVGKMLTD